MATNRFVYTGLYFAILATSVAIPEFVKAEVQCDINHAVIDGRTIAYGDEIEIVGCCTKNDDFFDMNGNIVLKAAIIAGRSNQDKIQFYLHEQPIGPRDERNEKERPPVKASLEAVKPDTWYKIRGFIADGNANAKHPAFSFLVAKCEAIPAAPLKLGEFVGREAQFEGLAAPDSLLKIDDEIVKLNTANAWPPETIGKKIRVCGIVRQDQDGRSWRLEKAKWQLLELADQVGQQVSLDGHLGSLNGNWWFEYRGERIYLTDNKGRLPSSRYVMDTAAGGNIRMGTGGEIGGVKRDVPFIIDSDNHGRRVLVTGKLIQQKRPSLQQISEKSDRDFTLYYVVRNTKIEYLKAGSHEEIFRHLYTTPYQMTDGLPELLAESSWRRNIMGNETRAMLFYERNDRAIEWIFQHENASTTGILAKRMQDEKLNSTLRLLYAAMLAAKNDPRGKEFLTEAVKRGLNVQFSHPIASGRYFSQELTTSEENSFADSLYCLGAVAWLVPRDSKVKFEWNWAEPTLIDIFTHKNGKGIRNAARAALRYSCVFQILLHLNTEAARKTAMDFALSQDGIETEAVSLLCQGSALLPLDDLRRLEAAVKEQRDRQTLLSQFLRHKSPDAVRLFYKDLGDSFTYMDFCDHLGPEVTEALRAELPHLSGQARINAKMLILLAEKDPVPSILKLLDDPKWLDKNLALYELARLKDVRAVAPVARLLREAPSNFFQVTEELKGSKDIDVPAANFSSDGEANLAVEHALTAIAHTSSKEAVSELIGLLSVDLSRFGTYTDRAGWQRVVANHLIEITGESYDTDAAAWRKWHDSNRGWPRFSNRGGAATRGILESLIMLYQHFPLSFPRPVAPPLSPSRLGVFARDHPHVLTTAPSATIYCLPPTHR